MKTQVTLNKSEIKLLLDGLKDVLIEENDKSRRPSGWKATARYLAAEALEKRLLELTKPQKGYEFYRIAYARADGGWDIVETFTAASHDEANEYAAGQRGDDEWYVLDSVGRNINGGAQ
jgi:hypothetical protein